ncbi:MAG: hypothetical protein H0W48_00195 [Methylibium sp.]|nr:hypothetical protein [Methylibium sp.]
MRSEFLSNARTFFSCHDDDISLSIASKPSFGGLKDDELKACVTRDEGAEFRKFAREHGYRSASDCLRELALIAMQGVDGVANVHRERLEALGGKLPTSRPETTDTKEFVERRSPRSIAMRAVAMRAEA